MLLGLAKEVESRSSAAALIRPGLIWASFGPEPSAPSEYMNSALCK